MLVKGQLPLLPQFAGVHGCILTSIAVVTYVNDQLVINCTTAARHV